MYQRSLDKLTGAHTCRSECIATVLSWAFEADLVGDKNPALSDGEVPIGLI